MPDYQADPDIRSIGLDGRVVVPPGLEERGVRENPPSMRPQKEDLLAAAYAAMGSGVSARQVWIDMRRNGKDD